MDEQRLEKDLAEALTNGWSIVPTGAGFLVVSNWVWPNGDPIEIHVRRVGESEKLFLTTDGGELFNCLYMEGLDFTKETRILEVVERLAENHGTKLVDYQIARGSHDENLGESIRNVLEAVKEISFYLWHRLGDGAIRH